MIGDGFSGLGVIYILICMLSGQATLTQICIGVSISSVFSSLLEPSYRATVTDLLSKEEYSKASGMVSIAGSARYLISPLLAGVLLAVSDIKLLLLIDIATFFLTVVTTGIVRRGIETKKTEKKESFFDSLKVGWKAITVKKGIFVLIVVSSLISCFMGVIQTLVDPMILDFAESQTLGIAKTICACGMLVSGVALGMRGIKSGYVRILGISLALAGVAMAAFGVKQDISWMCGAGFLFFMMLPFANNCLDYLARTNIPEEKQGRAWGLIGFISQMGYVVAYGLAGVLADGIAEKWNITVGRGAAWVVIISGALMVITALFLMRLKSVRELEVSKEYAVEATHQ